MTVTFSAKPSTTPNWNTGAANRTTPSGAKQILGWTVGESPSSAFFNWWMNLEYQWQQWNEDAIDALNAGKADLDGDTFTGHVVLDAGVDLDMSAGNSELIFDPTFSLNGSDLLPKVTETTNLGSSTKTFASLHVEALVSYENGDTPLDDTGLVTLSQRKTTLACGRQKSATSTASLSSKHFNVASITRLGAGYYSIAFDTPVDDDAGVFVTLPTTGATPRLGTAEVQAGGATALVRVYEESAGTFSLTDYPFSFVVIGSPDVDI